MSKRRWTGPFVTGQQAFFMDFQKDLYTTHPLSLKAAWTLSKGQLLPGVELWRDKRLRLVKFPWYLLWRWSDSIWDKEISRNIQLLKRQELLALGTSAVNICQLISGLLITSYSKTVLQQLFSEKPFSYSLYLLKSCCAAAGSQPAHICIIWRPQSWIRTSHWQVLAQTQSKKWSLHW